jgi:hypothetical protein
MSGSGGPHTGLCTSTEPWAVILEEQARFLDLHEGALAAGGTAQVDAVSAAAQATQSQEAQRSTSCKMKTCGSKNMKCW